MPPIRNPARGRGWLIAKLAKMVADVSKGKTASGTETVGDLLTEWLDHCDSLGRSPTTMREYRRIAEKIVRPDWERSDCRSSPLGISTASMGI